MNSSNKTTNLNLNKWTETDRPVRADFVADNNLIDNILGGHAINTSIHLTADEKARVSSPFQLKIVQGTDESSRSITFGFSPYLVICFAVSSAPTEVSSGTVIMNWGIAAKNYGASGGCSLSESTFTVSQGTQNGVRYNLNNSEYQYIIVAFK